MSNILLGLRIPNRSYEQLTLENIDLDKKNILHLKNEISKKINLTSDEIELIYCGSVLKDDKFPTELDIKSNSLIHVVKKNTKKIVPEPLQKTYTKEECKKLAELFGSVTGTQINVNIRIIILTKIIIEYPGFRRNIGAQALIRDSVLFHSLDKPEVIETVARTYPIICESAEFIVKTTKKELAKNVSVVYSNDESPYDSPSSSEEENNANQSEQARIRRISRDELAAALQALGPSSFNSLANIAQRNALLQQHRETNLERQAASSSTASSSNPNRITSSLLNNALAQALLGTLGSRNQTSISQASQPAQPEPQQTQQSPQEQQSDQAPAPAQTNNIPSVVISQPAQPESMDTTETEETPAVALNNNSARYATQLRTMREMGLLNDDVNLNVLIMTNGNLENAINLVLTSNFDNDFN